MDWKNEWLFEVAYDAKSKSLTLRMNEHCTLRTVHRWVAQYLMAGLRPRGRSEAQILSLIERAMITPSMTITCHTGVHDRYTYSGHGSAAFSETLPVWVDTLKLMLKKEQKWKS
jgi:hypothetical protein